MSNLFRVRVKNMHAARLILSLAFDSLLLLSGLLLRPARA